MTELADVLGDIELADVQTFALEANLAKSADFEEGREDFTLDFRTYDIDDQMVFRFRLTARTPSVQASVDAGAFYVWTSSDHGDLTADLRAQFVGKVAVMAVYPYLRAALQNLTNQLGEPVVAPITRLGAFEVSAEDLQATGYEK